MAYQIPQDVRPILASLAEAVFPVQDWVKKKKPPKYDQLIPPVGRVPWRPTAADPSLGTSAFEIVAFLEALTNADAINPALAPRWNAIRADPAKYFQHRSGKTSAQWRAERGLKDARFGVFEPDSSNFAFVSQGADGSPKDALSRAEFYDNCWDPLARAFQVKPPSDPAAWIAFRDNLRTDQFDVWPTSPVRSSAFVKQFTLDVLTACLGQRNTAMTQSDPVWKRAVLIELGENRFPGNRYTVQHANRAVGTFLNSI